MAIKFQLLDN